MTYYDTLGVTRHASDAQLRAAYRSRARQLHPDLRRDRTSTELAGGEEAMRRLNEAWHVLGEPTRRCHYDRCLDELPGPVGHAERATEERPAQVEGPAGPAGVIAVVTLLGTVLAGALVVAFVALNQTSGQTRTEGLMTGDCVTAPGGHISEIVSCDSANDGQVVAEIPRGQACPTTAHRLVDGRSGSTFVCLDTTGR